MRCALCLTALCALSWPMVSFAQINSMFGGRTGGQGGLNSNMSSFGGQGMTGGRSGGFGQSGQSGSLFGNSGFASSSMGGMGSGIGSNSQSGSGFGSGFGGQFGNTGFGNTGFGNMGAGMGMGTNAIPIVGQSDNRGRQVGNRLAGQQGSLGALQALQGLQGFQRRGGSNRANRSGGNDRERLPLRPTQRIAFDVSAATPTAAVERVATRFTAIAESRPELSEVTFAADDAGNVVLRGNVDSEESARLVAALVRLEPGVREVVNELTIADGTTP